MSKRDYDSIVVGSGPNGLASAITMQSVSIAFAYMSGISFQISFSSHVTRRNKGIFSGNPAFYTRYFSQRVTCFFHP